MMKKWRNNQLINSIVLCVLIGSFSGCDKNTQHKILTVFFTGVPPIKDGTPVEEQKVTTAFLPVGESEVELLESTSPDGPISKYIEKKGQGVQHIAFRVDDIEAALTELKEKGVRLIDEKPRVGAGGAKIAFLHPKATGGVLVELCER